DAQAGHGPFGVHRAVAGARGGSEPAAGDGLWSAWLCEHGDADDFHAPVAVRGGCDAVFAGGAVRGPGADRAAVGAWSGPGDSDGGQRDAADGGVWDWLGGGCDVRVVAGADVRGGEAAAGAGCGSERA